METLSEETLQKLSLSSKVRELEETRESLQDQLNKEEQNKSNLQRQVSTLQTQVNDLQKANRSQETQLEEMKAQMEELEGELQVSEDARIRLEVNLLAAKSNFDRDAQRKEEEAEKERTTLIRQLREMKTELEEERRQKGLSYSAKKKLEDDFKDRDSHVENVNNN